MRLGRLVRLVCLGFATALALFVLMTPCFRSKSVNDQACSSLILQTNRDTYMVGERVKITVTYIPLLPGCVGVMIAHDYVVKIEILNEADQETFASTNSTVGSLMVHGNSIPAETENYTIEASSWLRLARNDFD